MKIYVDRDHAATAAILALVGITVIMAPPDCMKWVAVGMALMAAFILLGQWASKAPPRVPRS